MSTTNRHQEQPGLNNRAVGVPEADGSLIVERRVCADCDEVFSLTRREVDWFENRGLHPPRRCEPCRRARRLADAQYDRQGLPTLRTRNAR